MIEVNAINHVEGFEINSIRITCITTGALLSLSSAAFGDGMETKTSPGWLHARPFLFYEASSGPLKFSGASSGYKMGAAGISFLVNPGGILKASADLGAGYAPSQLIGISGSTFTGSVKSRYFGAAMAARVYQSAKAEVFVTLGMENSDLSLPDLRGYRGEVLYTGHSEVGLSHRFLGMQYVTKKQKNFEVTYGLGLNDWDFTSVGEMRASEYATLTKDISSSGRDPYMEFGLNYSDKRYDLGVRYEVSRVSADEVIYVSKIGLTAGIKF